MQLKKLALAAAALFIATAATAATQLAPIPVTISGTVAAACSTTTTALAFNFGNVASGSLSSATEKTDVLSINCSSGTAYTFSTAAGTQSSSYNVNAGSSTTEDGFPLACVDSGGANVQPNPDGPVPVKCDETTGSSTAAGKVFLAVLNADASYGLLDGAYNGDGNAQTITLAARLTSSAATNFDDSANKVGNVTGAISASNANFYVTY